MEPSVEMEAKGIDSSSNSAKIGLPVARFDVQSSKLPPQATFHLKSKTMSLWNSKTATKQHWDWDRQQKDTVRVEGEDHPIHGFRPVKPGLPKESDLPVHSLSHALGAQSANDQNAISATMPSQANTQSRRDIKPLLPKQSPRTRWIIERRNRHHVWARLAQPTKQIFGVKAYVDPSCKELLRSKGITKTSSQRSSGAAREHHEAVTRISERLNRKKHELGVASPSSGDEQNEDLDGKSFSFYDEGTWTAPVNVGVAKKQVQADPSRVLTQRHKAELRAGHYTPRGRKLKLSLHSYELDSRIAACRQKLKSDLDKKIHNPGLSRRQRARQRRVRFEKLAVMIVLLSRAAKLESHLKTQREVQKIYLLRTVSAYKIQRWYRKICQMRITEKMAKALKVLRRFFLLAMVGSQLRQKKRSADTMFRFLETYAKHNVSNLIRKFRRKIILGQRCFRTWSTCTRSRLFILEKLWDQELQKIIDQEHQRLETAKKQQLEFEAELLDESAKSFGQKVLLTAKRRGFKSIGKKQNKNKIGSLKNVVAGMNMKPRNPGSLAMQLLHERTKRVMESTKLHHAEGNKKFAHLTVSEEIRRPLLLNLLRKKRSKYQESLAAVTHKMIARRNINVKLSREDVRRFIQSGVEASVEHHISSDDKKIKDDKHRGFLMIKSLYRNEMMELVLEGLRQQHGNVPVVVISGKTV